jgi:hypothetical protein
MKGSMKKQTDYDSMSVCPKMKELQGSLMRFIP